MSWPTVGKARSLGSAPDMAELAWPCWALGTSPVAASARGRTPTSCLMSEITTQNLKSAQRRIEFFSPFKWNVRLGNYILMHGWWPQWGS